MNPDELRAEAEAKRCGARSKKNRQRCIQDRGHVGEHLFHGFKGELKIQRSWPTDPAFISPVRDASAAELRVGEIVLVRGYRGEPAKLTFAGLDGPYVLVNNKDTESGIGLPTSVVYKWSEEVFASITEAFQSQDWQRLDFAWQNASPLCAEKTSPRN